MHVSSLHIYPVKGCRGLSLTSSQVDAFGFVGDRRFLIVDEENTFLTQRTLPDLALLETALTAEGLLLSTAGREPLHVPTSEPEAPKRIVRVWSSEGLVTEDCGDAAAAWLTDALKKRVRLVRIGRDYDRPVKPSKARPGDVISFVDAYPFLVISEASLADLNDRLIQRGEDPVPMNRFRPSIVVSGADPYGEDAWGQFSIGNIAFRAGGLCVRCIVTTTDQFTAVRGKEPLRTLAGYRRDPEDSTRINFGQNAIHENKSGTIKVGDAVRVLDPAAT